MLYAVIFSQYSEFEVEADSESEAIDIAYEEFRAEQCSCIADTHYDDVDVEEIDNEVE